MRMMTLMIISGLTVFTPAKSEIGADMMISGTIRPPPPCTITQDGNENIDVDFGQNVAIRKIDGHNYRQPMNYQIQCEPGNHDGMAFTLILKGPVASFDSSKAALQTSIAGLAIKVYQNSQPLVLNKPLIINQENPPTLEVVPVKNSTSELAEGLFEATATLQAEYQ